MEIVVEGEKENQFFKRKEISLIVKHEREATPSKAAIKKELASRYGCDESQIVIDYIFTKKGVCESLAKIKILKEKETKEQKVGVETGKEGTEI